MYLTVHSMAGLIVARATTNPWLAFILGIASHFLLDMIPHGDEFLTAKHFTRPRVLKRLLGASIIDGVLTVGFVGLYVWTTPFLNMTTVLMSLLGALLPDMLHGVYMLTEIKWLKKYERLHSQIHNLPGHQMDWAHGLFVQTLALTALWLMLI